MYFPWSLQHNSQLEKQACVLPLLLLYFWKSAIETEVLTIIHSLTMKTSGCTCTAWCHPMILNHSDRRMQLVCCLECVLAVMDHGCYSRSSGWLLPWRASRWIMLIWVILFFKPLTVKKPEYTFLGLYQISPEPVIFLHTICYNFIFYFLQQQQQLRDEKRVES